MRLAMVPSTCRITARVLSLLLRGTVVALFIGGVRRGCNRGSFAGDRHRGLRLVSQFILSNQLGDLGPAHLESLPLVITESAIESASAFQASLPTGAVESGRV